MHRSESIKPNDQTTPRSASGEFRPLYSTSHVYRLKFEEENGRPAKDVEFEAEDSYEALIIAHQEARTRAAELWRDGQKLCSIKRAGAEVWEIWPAS